MENILIYAGLNSINVPVFADMEMEQNNIKLTNEHIIKCFKEVLEMKIYDAQKLLEKKCNFKKYNIDTYAFTFQQLLPTFTMVCDKAFVFMNINFIKFHFIIMKEMKDKLFNELESKEIEIFFFMLYSKCFENSINLLPLRPNLHFCIFNCLTYPEFTIQNNQSLSEISNYISPTSYTLETNIYGISKEKYSLFARLCQNVISFYQKKLCTTKRHDPIVQYVSSKRGLNLLNPEYKNIHQYDLLQLNWTEKKGKPNFFFPKENVLFIHECYLNMNLCKQICERILEMGDIVVATELKDTHLDLSNAITPKYARFNTNNFSELRNELNKLNQTKRKQLTNVNLSDNYLEWKSDSVDLKYLLTSCSNLRILNLSYNKLGGRLFCNWLLEIHELHASLKIDVSGNHCKYIDELIISNSSWLIVDEDD